MKVGLEPHRANSSEQSATSTKHEALPGVGNLVDHSASSTILRDSAFMINRDESVTTGRFGKSPHQNTPRAIRLPFRCLKLRLIKPRVIGGDRLSGNRNYSCLVENSNLA